SPPWTQLVIVNTFIDIRWTRGDGGKSGTLGTLTRNRPIAKKIVAASSPPVSNGFTPVRSDHSLLPRMPTMTARRLSLLLGVFACLGLSFSAAPGQAPAASKEFLFEVARGQVPGDTGMDDKTTMEIVDSKELGGKALKVPFAKGDSFGIPKGAAKDWKKFAFV